MLQNKDAVKFKKINNRAIEYWREVPAASETGRMQRPLIPVTVIANKWDEFSRTCEPIQKKTMNAALRDICHRNGADLVYASVREQKPLKNFRSALLWRTYMDAHQDAMRAAKEGGDEAAAENEEGENAGKQEADSDLGQIPKAQVHPDHPVCCLAGTDSFRNIPEPPGAQQRKQATEEQLWMQQIKAAFKQ